MALETWKWPVVAGEQRISFVSGELQDSAAHALRGVGPAVDLPANEGQAVQSLSELASLEYGFDNANGNFVVFSWDGTRGRWQARYSHLQTYGELRAGQTGQAQGPHVHLVLWLDGLRVRPEDQPEFAALYEEVWEGEMARTEQQKTILAFLHVNTDLRLSKVVEAARWFGYPELATEVQIAVSEIQVQIQAIEAEWPV